MATARPLDVFCWPAKGSLHSFSPECLAVLAYSQFNRASVKPNKCVGLQQYKASVPVVYDGDRGIEGMQPVLIFMRRRGWNADYWLSEEQQADTLAFIALVEEKLQPVILHLLFVNVKNFTDCVRGFYADSCSFPWNFYIPGHLQKRAKQTLSVLHGSSHKNSELPDTSFQKKVVAEARHCINLLSNFLGDKVFLFGNKPTTLDAVLYGYMAFLLKADLPNNVLCTHVQECQNLTRFVARVDDQFMNAMPKGSIKWPDRHADKNTDRYTD
jgi:metaxin